MSKGRYYPISGVMWIIPKDEELTDNVMHSVCFIIHKKKFRSALIACMLIVTGCINAETLDRINPDDAGGQYDSSGGADGDGNPAGSVCTGYDFGIIASP